MGAVLLLLLDLSIVLLIGGASAAAGDAAALHGVLKGLRKSGSYGRLKGSWRPGTEPCAAGGW